MAGKEARNQQGTAKQGKAKQKATQPTGKLAPKTAIPRAKRSGERAAPQRRPAPKRPAGKDTPAPSPATSARQPLPSVLFYRLNTFLHTVRAIGSYEDRLCTLLHASRTEGRPKGTPNAALCRDLLHLLDEMPAGDYRQEWEALQEAARTSSSMAASPGQKRGRSAV